MSIHRCPKCNSASVHRTRRRGVFEHLLLRLVLLRPYRCWSCNDRHYAYLFLRKSPGKRLYATTFTTVFNQVYRPIPLLSLLLFVPWALASTGSDLMLLGFKLRKPPIAITAVPEIAPTGQLGQESLARDQVPGGIVLASALPWAVAVGGSTAAQDKPEDSPELAPNRPAPTEQEMLGTVASSGEVTINGTPIPQVATVYADDTIATGTGGNAVIKLQGKGNIEVYPGTSMSFPNTPRYLAQLDHGLISFRPLQQAQGFQIRVGKFVVVPDPGSTETSANVSRDANGQTRLKAVQGSVGIIELEGPQTSFIRNGQEMTINADGRILGAPASPATPSPVAPTSAGGGGGHAAIILAGVGAGGAAAAALALSGSDETPAPLSPSNP